MRRPRQQKSGRASFLLASNRVHSFRVTGSAAIRIFSVAPSHNEPDLGRCMFPQPASAGGTASTCTAYARYLFSGYIEFQPLGRTPARHFFLFFEPKLSFGRNIRSSPTLRPCCRSLTIVRLESLSNCRKTSNCVRRNIRCTGSGVIAGPGHGGPTHQWP